MKKAVILLSILAFLFVANVSYAESPGKKAVRGLVNLLSCPLEISNGVGDAFEENGILAASTWGVVDGFLRMGGRGLCGLYEAITFPLPPYDPIIKNPEFLLEDWFK